MAVSVFDLFKVGIGPSSSHTVGPMRAARLFALRLGHEGMLETVQRVRCELFGSLGATGRGHASDTAVILGLCGEEPDRVDVDGVPSLIARVRQARQLPLLGTHAVPWDPDGDIVFNPRALPYHPNALRLTAFGARGQVLDQHTYYSVGGGFVVSEELAGDRGRHGRVAPAVDVLPLPFHSGDELLAVAAREGLDIAGVMRVNEAHWRAGDEIDAGLDRIADVMHACIDRGCQQEGTLPGALKVPRRAPGLHRKLQSSRSADPLAVMDWVNLYALAVNEENASGGRVVTAPTNGAAGIVPAVLRYYTDFVPGGNSAGVRAFLLTAGAIGLLYKENASISGAEVGCQGEVGVACSMAAAGLCAVLGGTPGQVENAAEIGMEHHLGLTCDPVAGLVQIPCIERNAVAAVQAINAARLALHGDGQHHVSLDQVIKTMRETGADMQSKYKETSLGGLAVNIVAC